MCDQTEVSYLPDDIVWVKLGPVWWPGRVCKEEEIPPEIMKDLRKTPIAIVKFFHEDSFEYVKKLSNIYHYNCLKKNEFIKKGLDMIRSKNRDAPSNMKLFPKDVVTAEHLTGGNTHILEDDIFLPEEKPSYTDLFTSTKKSPKKIKLESKKKLTPVKPSTPRVITHPRFLRLSSGHTTDYEARERKQEPLRAECDEVDNSQPTTYRCSDCEFTTIRLNVMVLHNKSHTRNFAATPQSASKATKRKSVSTGHKYESRVSIVGKWRSNELEPVSAKVPKTNGTMKRSSKTPIGHKKSIAVKTKVKKTASKNAKEIKVDALLKTSTPNIIKPKHSAPKTDEFQNSLLEDWAEYEIEQETGDKSAQVDEVSTESTAISDTSIQGSDDGENAGKDMIPIEKSKNNKSCFDFDDNDDSIVIDQSKMKFGRKIPRLLNETKNMEIERKDHVAESDNKDTSMEIDKTKKNASLTYRMGFDESITEQCMNEVQNQTSHLQEMGVDNEIEIKTEESTEESSDNLEKSTSERNDSETTIPSERKEKDSDITQISEKVDKLLQEISVGPKLPELPRSHKKAHLKAYCDSIASQKIDDESLNAKESTESSEQMLDKSCINGESGMKILTADSTILEKQSQWEVAEKPISIAEMKIEIVENFENTPTTSVHNNVTESVDSNSTVNQPASGGSQTLVLNEEATSEVTGVVEKQRSAKRVKNETVIAEPIENVEIADSSLEDVNDVAKEKISDNVADTKSILTAEGNIVSEVATSVATKTITTTPLKSVQRTPIKFSTTPKLKQINTSQLLKSGQKTFILCTNPNKGTTSNAAGSILVSNHQIQSSPLKVISTQSAIGGGDQTKLLTTNLKVVDGKNIVRNLSQPQKVVLSSAASSKLMQLGSSKQIILVNRKPGTSVSLSKTSTTPNKGVNSIELSNTKVRLASNILPKSGLKNAPITKSGKNIVSGALQVLMQPQSNKSSQLILTNVASASVVTPTASAPVPTVQVMASQSSEPLSLLSAQNQQQEVMYVTGDDGKNYEVVNTPTTGQPLNMAVDFNYIVDASGNLINVPNVGSAQETCDNGGSVVTLRDKDILAKALENTDGLQIEMALSNASQSALDSCSVAQNTAVSYKTETVYENLTLNTPPIMSTYETPSRALDSTAISEVPNEMIIISGGTESTEYLA